MVLVVKYLPAYAGDVWVLGSSHGSRRSPRGGDGKPLQYSCLENSMDRGTWQASLCCKESLQPRWSDYAHVRDKEKFRVIISLDQGRTLDSAASRVQRCEEKKVKLLSHVWLFVTPWTVAHQAPPSMGFSRQEYWSGLPFVSLIPLHHTVV